MTNYVAQAVAVKIVRVSSTTLFRVAAKELGDATLWYRIAALNDMSDPWITGYVELKIPAGGVASNGGIPNQ